MRTLSRYPILLDSYFCRICQTSFHECGRCKYERVKEWPKSYTMIDLSLRRASTERNWKTLALSKTAYSLFPKIETLVLLGGLGPIFWLIFLSILVLNLEHVSSNTWEPRFLNFQWSIWDSGCLDFHGNVPLLFLECKQHGWKSTFPQRHFPLLFLGREKLNPEDRVRWWELQVDMGTGNLLHREWASKQSLPFSVTSR